MSDGPAIEYLQASRNSSFNMLQFPTITASTSTCAQHWPASPWISGHLCIA
jgi:hypothetical protein